MQAWEQFLQQQEKELGSSTVEKWLRSLKILRYDACNLYLEAKDSFQTLWFEEHIRSKAQAKLFNGNHKRIKIHLSLAASSLPNTNTEWRKTKKEHGKTSFKLEFDDLDPHCLFQHYVVSKDNELPHQLLCELAGLSKNEGSFNPMYLYGPTGCGKTHLLMSLAHCFRAKGLKCIYVRAEQFTDHVVSAIRAGEMSLFREAYRNADVLLVDDVHVFSRKGATQEEFFHTFNSLHLESKQIVLTANCSPQELNLIEPRLVSRFEWGIVLPLKPLSAEELRTMLLSKAHALQFHLNTKIIDFLTETFISSPKALIKAFEGLMLRLHLDSQNPLHQLSVQAVKTLLSDLIAQEQKSAIIPEKIIEATAEHYGIRTEDILGRAQSRDCALPRQIAMHLCRTKLKMPFMKIGDIFSRDHSTVMSSVKYIQKLLDDDSVEVAGAWHSVLKKLQIVGG